MKRHAICLLLGAVLITPQAYARDTVESYAVDAALHSEPSKVSDDVTLYFAGQDHPGVAQSYGAFATNKKTSAFGKSDLQACQHVFLSAVIELQERARQEGGNAVINIKSNYKDHLSESATEFVCGAGAVVAGVALVGDVVTLKK